MSLSRGVVLMATRQRTWVQHLELCLIPSSAVRKVSVLFM